MAQFVERGPDLSGKSNKLVDEFAAAQRAAKKQRKKDFMTVFRNGKQVRVRRPPTIAGMEVEEYIRQNAEIIWLHQHGYWEIIHEREMEEAQKESAASGEPKSSEDPF